MSNPSVACPECARKLKVPPSLLGRKVKCPACAAVFVAEDPASEPVDEIIDDLEVVDETSPRPRAVQGSARPKRRPRREVDDDDDQEDDYDTPRPRRRKRGSRARAASAVAGPAIGLIIVGTLGIVAAILSILFNLTRPDPPPNALAASGSYKVGTYIGMFVTTCWSVAVLYGGIKMKGLEDSRNARAAAILAMVPCSLAWVIGLPCGIWALVALSKPEVKRAFRD